MPNSDAELSAERDRHILTAIYYLEDARRSAEKSGDHTFRYFIEMALAYAKSAVGTARQVIELNR